MTLLARSRRGNAPALTVTRAGRVEAARPTVGDAGQENFIPWSQIEPLVTPGMNGLALAAAVIARLGLRPSDYNLATIDDDNTLPLSIVIRRGVHVVRRTDSLAWRDAGDEVVA